LLDALPSDAAAAVSSALERVHLPARSAIYGLGEPMGYVYFPIDAVLSVATVMRDGTQIEVLTLGREGLCGAQALLDGATVTTMTTAQVGGEAYRMPVDAFVALAQEWPAFRSLIERLLSAQMDVMAQSIACNRLHLVNERCARWLLTMYDRVGRPDFPLTHELLATMLGVRRAGVSIAAATLQHAGFIRYVRGKFTIVDREGLATAACECYDAINHAYGARLLPSG
jgi:CRP-like cAMP-binding protein